MGNSLSKLLKMSNNKKYYNIQHTIIKYMYIYVYNI